MNKQYSQGIFLAILLSLGFTLSASANTIDVVISARAPYYILDVGSAVSGIIAAPAADVFKAAGLDIRWVKTSFNRQLKILEDNLTQTCAIGWFKNPDREKYAKFSEYIYQDKPLIALARTDNEKISHHRTLSALLNDQSLILARKLGFSLGSVVDGLLEKTQARIIITPQDNTGMTRMLIGRRFDYMLMSPEEGEYLISKLGIVSEDVVMIKLRDLPPGNKRYILCSQKVSDENIERLNSAIRNLLR